MKKVLLIILIFSVFIFSPLTVFAEDFTITGNGESSQNQIISSDSTSTTSVTQENNAEVNNNVDTVSDSGSNNIEDSNSSDSLINTGNSESISSVENENLNINITENDCFECPVEESQIKISGNESESNNSINVNLSTNINSSQINDASISNKVFTIANSGNNQIIGNNGDAEIDTGDVYAESQIKNININFNKLKIVVGENTFNLILSDNGIDSMNQLKFIKDRDINYESNNYSELVNNVQTIGESGSNSVFKNLGDVLIKTGNVIVKTTIENVLNKSYAEIICEECEEEKPSPTPTPTTTPGGPSNGGGEGGPSSSSSSSSSSAPAGEGGEVGAAEGQVLPATGPNFILILLTFGAITGLTVGFYLRRKTSSPISS